jgi:hypothetical protein
MSKEASENKKTNPLVYILGIPVGILILVVAYNIWQTDSVRRACASNIRHLDTPFTMKIGEGCLKVLGR